MVPPGRHEYRHVIHEGLRIPYDETTIHVVTGHLHPYGESIELRDATENKSLFKARAETAKDRVALTLLEAYTSAEGFPVYTDHQYEIVSVYDNTTDHDVDAMAVLYLYFYEKSFDRARINLK